MASIKMIDEDEATGKVTKIYSEIKESLGIDFVPNMYKIMAHKPDYLETTWNKNLIRLFSLTVTGSFCELCQRENLLYVSINI
jgi:hypothetical protein